MFATAKLEKPRPKRRPGVHKRIKTNVTKLKPTGVKYLGWALLYMGKPFTRIGNWFWKKHRKVLDWNK